MRRAVRATSMRAMRRAVRATSMRAMRCQSFRMLVRPGHGRCSFRLATADARSAWPRPQSARLLQEVHDRRLGIGRIRRRISVDLPRVPGGLPPVRRHPLSIALYASSMRSYGPRWTATAASPAWRFGRVHLARSFKCARDLDAEVAQYRRARLLRVVVEEDVVAVSPQPWLAANELPDLVQRRPPRRANRARRDLAPHRGQLAGVNSLYVDGDGHSSIVNQVGQRGVKGVRTPITDGDRTLVEVATGCHRARWAAENWPPGRGRRAEPASASGSDGNGLAAGFNRRNADVRSPSVARRKALMLGSFTPEAAL